MRKVKNLKLNRKLLSIPVFPRNKFKLMHNYKYVDQSRCNPHTLISLSKLLVFPVNVTAFKNLSIVMYQIRRRLFFFFFFSFYYFLSKNCYRGKCKNVLT